MSIWESLAVYAAFGQMLVIAVGTIFAFLQLSGLRRQQEAELVERIFEKLNSEHLAAALDLVYNGLAEKLGEPKYLAEILEGRATAASHTELVVMHFFNGLGLLVHTKMVGEYPIVPFIASPCLRAWQGVAPVVELMRRRFPHAYTPFESLVARSRSLDLSLINARFRSETPGLRAEWETSARELSQAGVRNDAVLGKTRSREPSVS